MTRSGPVPVPDDGPEDIEAFRRDLIRRMNNMLREWRSCDQPICRRARKCVAKNLACSQRPSTMTTQQASRAKFMLKRALEKRLAECRNDDNGEVKTAGDGGKKTSGRARSHHAPTVRPTSKTTAPAAQAASPPQTNVNRSAVLARTRKS
jgi:hypothetical protein